MVLDYLYMEESISQLFYSGLDFCFMSKNGVAFDYFSKQYFLDFIKYK